jgi:hypothetical protein
LTDRSGSAARPSVALCCGKDCVKDTGFAELRDALTRDCDVRETRCLGICKGPMAIIGPGAKKPRVLKRLRKRKQRRDLLAVLLDGAPLSNRLKRRLASGKKRRSALRKAR